MTEVRTRIIPFAQVDCSGNEQKYVAEVLKSGWLTTASKTKQLEQRIGEFLGAKYALAVNSCTSGLHLALDALGVQPGDRVFVPSMTFTASAEVIRYMGADPVLLDVDYETALLTAETLERAIKDNPDVKVLIAVHFGGAPLTMLTPDEKGLVDICRRHGVRIVEDAAHALPTRWQGRPIGTFGDITCFSFYANKTMTTGEGGMITTQDDELAERIRLMRLHGIDRDIWDRFTSEKVSWEYDVVAPGYKYNMPDLNAAVGLAQFERLHEMHASRIRCAKLYFENLAEIRNIELPMSTPNMSDHSWHLFPIKIKPEASMSRNQVIEALKIEGIGTSVHYKPLHQLSYYRERYDLKASDFPGSEAIWQRTLSLPIYNSLSDESVHCVCDALKALDL